MQAAQMDQQLQKCRDAIRKNNADYAIQILSMQVLKADPNHREAYEVFFQAVDAKWKKKKPPKPGGFTRLLGSTTKLLNNPDKVIENCLKKYAESPSDGSLLQQLAEAHRTKGYWNAAEVTCGRWTKLDGNNAIAYFWLAQAQDQNDNIADAVQAIQVARSLDKTNRDIGEYARDLEARKTLKGKGSVGLDEAKDFRDVLADKDGAAKTEKERRGFTSKKDVEGLLEEYGGWAKADKKALQDVAEKFEKVGGYAEAVKAWKRLYEKDDTYVDALDKAGELTIKHYNSQIELGEKKGLDEAKLNELRTKRDTFTLQEYTRRVKSHPTDLALRYKLGEGLYNSKRFDDAAKQLQKAVRDPRYANKAGIMLARSFFEIGQYDVAIMQLNKMLDNKGEMGEELEIEARYWKARSLLAKDLKDEAKNLLMEIYMENSEFRDIDQLLRGL